MVGVFCFHVNSTSTIFCVCARARARVGIFVFGLLLFFRGAMAYRQIQDSVVRTDNLAKKKNAQRIQ